MGFDAEIIGEFIAEANSLIAEISDNLLDLEQNPTNMELVNAIFRGFHTIKGAAGFMQFDSIVSLCHSQETLFDEVREGTLQVSSVLCSNSFTELDKLKEILHQLIIEQTDNILANTLNTPNNNLSFTEQNYQTQNDNCADCFTENSEQKNHSLTKQDNLNDQQIDEESQELCVNFSALNSNNNLVTNNSAQQNLQAIGNADNYSHNQNKSHLVEDEHNENIICNNLGKSNAQFIGKQVNYLNEQHNNNTSNLTNSNDGIKLNYPDDKQKDVTNNNFQTKFSSNEQHQTDKRNLNAGNTQLPINHPAITLNSAIKVDTAKLDRIVNLVGELVLLRNRLLHLSEAHNDENMQINAFMQSCGALNTLTCDLQNAVMQTRMQPLKPLFTKFKRLIRDTALELNKQVEFNIINADTELDKNLVESLENPLIHLLRNALDHGIETAEVRVQKGKSAVGLISISAKQIGEQIVINISDDGAGLNFEKIKDHAIKKGLIASDTNLTEHECHNLIFAPGFSTKDNVSSVSGRGVGMDVVKTNISKIGGTVEFSSKNGQGTSVNITLPLTLAILPTLMVEACGFTIAFAVSAIKEIITFDENNTKNIGNETLINIRGNLIPLIFLGNLLNNPESEIDYKYVVITQTAGGQVGFAVNNLLGQEEVIIKPLNHLSKIKPGFSGATITSAGDIALILDVTTLLAELKGANYGY